MVPVVVSWCSGFGTGSDSTPVWRDSASLRDMSRLVYDVPPGTAADWHPLPL